MGIEACSKTLMQTLRDIYTAGRGRRAAGGIFFGAVPVELPVGKQTGESLSVQPIEAQVPPSYGSCQVSVLQWWKPSVVNSALSVTDMRGRYKINDFRGRRGEPDSSPLLGDTAAGSPVPGAAVCGVGGIKKGRQEDVLSLRNMLGEHLLLKDFIAALVLLPERCWVFLFLVCLFCLSNS